MQRRRGVENRRACVGDGPPAQRRPEAGTGGETTHVRPPGRRREARNDPQPAAGDTRGEEATGATSDHVKSRRTPASEPEPLAPCPSLLFPRGRAPSGIRRPTGLGASGPPVKRSPGPRRSRPRPGQPAESAGRGHHGRPEFRHVSTLRGVIRPNAAILTKARPKSSNRTDSPVLRTEDGRIATTRSPAPIDHRPSRQILESSPSALIGSRAGSRRRPHRGADRRHPQPGGAQPAEAVPKTRTGIRRCYPADRCAPSSSPRPTPACRIPPSSFSPRFVTLVSPSLSSCPFADGQEIPIRPEGLSVATLTAASWAAGTDP